MASVVKGYDSMVGHKSSKVARNQRSIRAGGFLPDRGSTTPIADLPSRVLDHHPSDGALTPYQEDRGRASAHGPEPAVLAPRAAEAERVY
ncbi:hypothetical protein BHM03_00013157 [Ensete ventricosum]|nr:hypothetical protein BHM03_00013157 [Ensete ventricosum]